MQEADNRLMQYIRKKYLACGFNWDTYRWRSIILKLILNKRGEREWIRFMSQERA